ncbi:unnamed protein product [Heligmosomoides polygyrus]|uniref:AMOP domain-containing protein n=1 Tax=Heligmosomoides polygyrus TaxID=6339 RepID=A0A3P7YWP8_HELPZ|nr:unnamed protein product [Heligmosomoides polygyrus]
MKDDVDDINNRWYQPYAETLSMTWQALNLTYNYGARVDISLFGYWEDADRSHFVEVDTIAKGVTNSGSYSFKPTSLQRQTLLKDAWQKFTFGFVRVSQSDVEDGVLWSKPTPFPWYYLPDWKSHYGQNWALDMCIEWFEYDGKRRNFHSAGSSQQCCYDYDGYLMFTDDWEPDGDYTRFFQPGTPARAHKFGAPPFRMPPFIPTMSNYQLDLMPYRTCCTYAQHCEFYYWRRMTNGCQDYKAPAAGYAQHCEFYYWRRMTNGCQDYKAPAAGNIYGLSHLVTFDGVKYTFPGKGYFVLMMSDDPTHKLMVQIRLEQPDDTLWHSHVNATVITGIVVQENDSSVVQIFARKPMRRWRYRTDIYVDGARRYFDKPHWKYQQFRGKSRYRLPNMNQSEIVIMLKSGLGIRVHESYGMLDVMVSLPPGYNTTCNASISASSSLTAVDGTPRCYTTLGLLGVYNNDPNDDLTSSTGQVTRASGDTNTASTTQMIYEQFGMTWIVDGKNDRIGSVLFSEQFKPIYNPLLFASTDYTPVFWPQYLDLNASRIFNMEQVTSTCQGITECEYDYMMTGRREIGLTSLMKQKNFFAMQKSGSKQCECS